MAFTDAQKQLIEQYLQSLPDPQLDSTVAQNLTADQAQKILFYLCGQKKLKFVNYEYDGDGRPFFTLKGTTVQPPATAPLHYRIAGDDVFGVEFRYGIYSKDSLQLYGVEYRNAVLVCRMASGLKQTFGATVLYHAGIGKRGGDSGDAHDDGRAIDFAGIEGTRNNQSYRITVAEHWSNQPVSMPVDWTEPVTRKTYKMGQRLDPPMQGDPKVERDPWPTSFSNTYFRLDKTRNPHLDQTKNPSLANDVFKWVYDLGAAQGSDTATGAKTGTEAITSIGSQSSNILHPDYGSANTPKTSKNGRAAHYDHIHMQIGA
jgi:hypothetical protein